MRVYALENMKQDEAIVMSHAFQKVPLSGDLGARIAS
jgi:hypothetical protein